MSARTSLAVASGPATMKLACFVDTAAPPTRVPLSFAVSIVAAACPPGGFLNTLPQLGSASGWVRLRHARARLIEARIASPAAGTERERRGGHDRILREGRPPVRERGRLRGDRHRRHITEPVISRPERCRRSTVSARPRSSSRRPQRRRDGDAELEPAEPVTERDARERREWHRAARPDHGPVPGPPIDTPSEPEHEAGAPVGHEDVRSPADDGEGDRRLADRLGSRSRDRSSSSASRYTAAGPADPERRERRERTRVRTRSRTPRGGSERLVEAARSRRRSPLAIAIGDPCTDGIAKHPDVPTPHRHDQIALRAPLARGRSRRRIDAAGKQSAARVTRVAHRRRPVSRSPRGWGPAPRRRHP